MMNKVIVIGGGASGMACAITAARGGAQVILLERNSSNGKKIIVSGNGKCNYFNELFTSEHYYTSSNKDLSLIINGKNKRIVLDFLSSIGVVPMIKNGYYYPYSNQSVSILNSLLVEINKLKINIINDFFVEDIVKDGNEFIVYGGDKEYRCDKLVMACGSYSYYNYDNLNSYDLVRKLSFNIVKPLPALVPLVVNNNITKKWAGVRVNSKIKLYENNIFIKEEEGEINFTNYGISGICIMQFSGIISRGIDIGNKYEVCINFVPDITDNIDDMVNYLNEYDRKCPNRKVIEILDNLINYKIGNIIIGKYIDNYYNELSLDAKKTIANLLINYRVKIDGTKGFRESQVCSGGVSLNDININTMESINNKGLYIIGELLDINGDCGGYNLGFAWLSGILAGLSIVGDDND